MTEQNQRNCHAAPGNNPHGATAPIAIFRYQPRSIAIELVRMGGGGALCLAVASALPWGAALQLVLLPLAAFLLFVTAVMIQRGFSRLHLYSDAIVIDRWLCGSRPIRLRWTDVEAVRIILFKAKRSPIGGHYEVTLKGVKGGPRTIRFDSSVERFTALMDILRAALDQHHIAYERQTQAALDHLDSKRQENRHQD